MKLRGYPGGWKHPPDIPAAFTKVSGELNLIMNRNIIVKDFKRNKYLYLLVLPVILYYVLFHYIPIYGSVIAFENFSPMKGVLGSQWVGFKHFIDFFNGFYFWRLMRNTLLISFYSLLFGFPAPILLALLINEVKGKFFKKSVQTITYLPHFLSLVVVCGLIKEFTLDTGVINDIIAYLGGTRVTMLQSAALFRPVYVISGIWQQVGWQSIIYFAALSALDPQQYEAAVIDGAGKLKQLLHITLPGLMPTIVIMLILRIGDLMNVGFEKIILLYNPVTYDTADVIMSFVYRKGLQNFDWSFSAAIDFFNGIINFVLLISANWLSKKSNETSLW